MTTSYHCALNGVLLSALSERIFILDIQEDAPLLHHTGLALYPDGRRLLQQRREHITIKILFSVHEETPHLRSSILQQIRTWAAPGGTLTVSAHPGQQLQVICTDLPAATADDWTEQCVLTFQTTRCPYWEDEAETSVHGSGELPLSLPETGILSPVNALITNTAAEEITQVTLQAGSTRITFDGIHLQPGQQLLLNQTDGPLKAVINGVSILSCRTADSDDQLLIPCGRESTICAAASQSVSAIFSARGRYL